MKKTFLFILFIFMFTAGCSIYSVDSMDTTMEYYPSKRSSDDVIYIENLTKPHEIIGSVIVNAERRQKMSAIIEKMKYEAAILGGDAITEIEINSPHGWKKLPAQDLIGNAYIRANFIAKVIVFK